MRRLQRSRGLDAGGDAHATYWRVIGEARMLPSDELSARYLAAVDEGEEPPVLRALRTELCMRGLEPAS